MLLHFRIGFDANIRQLDDVAQTCCGIFGIKRYDDARTDVNKTLSIFPKSKEAIRLLCEME